MIKFLNVPKEEENESKEELKNNILNYVGRHISKEKSLLDSIKKFHDTLPLEPNYKIPIQIFTGNPQSYTRSKIVDSNKISNHIHLNKINLFVHSAYIVNLSEDTDKKIVQLNYLKNELKICAELGAKGTIVHVGKYIKRIPKEAMNSMFDNILSVLNEEGTEIIEEQETLCDKKCKLIIETPAGSGTELLTNIDDFIDFIKKLKETEHADRIGVCIDTCHVYSSGYEPDEYIQKVLDSGLTIDLVHLNDSKTKKYSRVDRHETPGEGFIGAKKLNNCIDICNKNGIPCVIE